MTQALEAFVIAAKAATYVSKGLSATPSRIGAKDLVFEQGPLKYRDSYFGGTDFLGQEVIWRHDTPIWAMNYYGRILRPDLIDGARAANVIRAALSVMYADGRFLGGFQASHAGFDYMDTSQGDLGQFTGVETISQGGLLAYQLDYHGGMIVP